MDNKKKSDKPTENEKNKKTTHLHKQDKGLKAIPKISSIENLSVIYLHNNSIERIQNLDGAHNLESLYLQNNRISRIENLGKLARLRKLFLGHNRISVVENLQGLDLLEELHVEKQELEAGEGLCFDPRTVDHIAKSLKVLNISGNNISSVLSLRPLRLLKVFLASDNHLDSISDLLDTIQPWYYLLEASFRGNPVAKSRRYRENIIARTMRLDILDKKQINEMTRCFIKKLEQANKYLPLGSLAEDNSALPRNYPHPLQKAVSTSIIKTGLSALNLKSSETTHNYIPWNALPQRRIRKSTERKPEEGKLIDKLSYLHLGV